MSQRYQEGDYKISALSGRLAVPVCVDLQRAVVALEEDADVATDDAGGLTLTLTCAGSFLTVQVFQNGLVQELVLLLQTVNTDTPLLHNTSVMVQLALLLQTVNTDTSSS
ncbi:hypothetical protein ACOMHN_004357 [Nucella lapillus]